MKEKNNKCFTVDDFTELTKGFYITLAIISVIFYAYGSLQLYEAKAIKRDLSLRIDTAKIHLDDVEKQCRDIMKSDYEQSYQATQ